MNEEKKQVDESWKEGIEKEKEALSKVSNEQNESELNKKDGVKNIGEDPNFEPDFNFFITTLAVQASIALGSMPNPVTQKVEINVSQAKLIIDTLGIIKDKTQGNLTTEEDTLLDNMLYELRTQYLSAPKGILSGEKK